MPDQTINIVALLLPKLTAGDRFTVVERSQINKLLHEQQLSNPPRHECNVRPNFDRSHPAGGFCLCSSNRNQVRSEG